MVADRRDPIVQTTQIVITTAGAELVQHGFAIGAGRCATRPLVVATAAGYPRRHSAAFAGPGRPPHRCTGDRAGCGRRLRQHRRPVRRPGPQGRALATGFRLIAVSTPGVGALEHRLGICRRHPAPPQHQHPGHPHRHISGSNRRQACRPALRRAIVDRRDPVRVCSGPPVRKRRGLNRRQRTAHCGPHPPARRARRRACP